jgi:cephalosporin hydroxylase
MDNELELNLHAIVNGHHNTTYRGVKMLKNPFDYLMYQMIINEVKPDLIIEIGTHYGGTSLYMADLLEINGNGTIHTIDVKDYVADDLVNNHLRIKRFLNGFENYDLSNTNGFNKILVIDDGSHHYNDVIKCMNKFKNIVSINSYFIIEDGSLNWMGWESIYDGGPLRSIKEFLTVNNNYVINRKWCDFFGKNATFNPNGFLQRIY